MSPAGVAAGLCVALSAQDARAVEVVGWIENVRIEPHGIVLRAKLDTGAKTSSLHVGEMEFVEAEGSRRIRFQVVDERGSLARIERPIVRTARIKRHFGRIQERPVILLDLCVDGLLKEAEVNLVDRSGFNYQLLIGRSFLAGDFIVDPGRTFTAGPRCTVD